MNVKLRRPVKGPYMQYVNTAVLFFCMLLSCACLLFAVYMLILRKNDTYTNIYLTACFPSGETVSSAVLLICLFVTGLIAAAELVFNRSNAVPAALDSALKLVASVYFSVFIRGIPEIRYSIAAAALYISVAAFSALSIPPGNGGGKRAGE